MREKQVLFNTPMVQAILEGRKTQTRRVVKPQPVDLAFECNHNDGFYPIGTYLYECGDCCSRIESLYVPGDILWVRETWNQWWDLDSNDQPIEGTEKYYYKADKKLPPYTDYVDDSGEHRDYPLWRPSIHMPREAARIFLRVTDVRVERLQEISEEDAKAEGVKSYFLHKEHGGAWEASNSPPFVGTVDTSFYTRKYAFQQIWNSINAKTSYGWDTNPWVWVYAFEPCEKPDDWNFTEN